MRWLFASIFLIAQAISVAAQDDKGRITQYLEDALSDLGREVRIEGFRGALSSRATMDSLTIADDTGVWLTLTDVVLDWNRSAVLRGRIEINEISAAQIELPRLPAPSDEISAEAGTFALPELPVSVAIGAISADRVVLGEPVVGLPATMSVTGAVSLAEGEGAANLAITRLDGPRGSFELEVGFSNATRVLAIDLELNEAADGLAATLLKLPGRPALELLVQGTAPIDDFEADVVLKSDGQERLTGRVGTRTPPISDDTDKTPARLIEADIAGDLTPLFAPQYRAFFGPDVALISRVSLFSDGRVSLDNLTISAAALRLTGEVALSADQLPEYFRLDAVLKDAEGGLVLLPLSGPETRVRGATISADFDSRLGDTWSLTGNLNELQRTALTLDNLLFTAGGAIQRGDTRQVTARIDGSASGISLTDPALAAALGTAVTLGADIGWRDGRPVEVGNLELEAQGLSLSGAGAVDGLDSAVSVNGAVQAQVEDLSRFSAISGRPLRGRLNASLSGEAALLTGAFDLVLDAVTTDLGVGIPDVDAALTGASRVNISAFRNAGGLTLRSANVITRDAEVEASGQVATGNSDLQFAAALNNVGRFVGGLDGPARISGRALEDPSGWSFSVDAEGPNAIVLEAQVSLPKNASASAQFDAKIGSVAWLVPDLTGPARVRGTASQAGDRWAVDAEGEGPGGSTLGVVGEIAQDASSAALDLNGTLPLALLNRRLKPNSLQGSAQFDLRLDGPIALSSLRGQARTGGAKLSLPGLRSGLAGIDAVVTLANSSAEFQTNATVGVDGQLTARGRIGLQAPFATDVALQVGNVRIADPKLYETRVNGELKLSGTIPANLSLAGRLVLDQTDILVPSTGIGALGEIPKIVHLNEPTAVRRTRSFAGLLDVPGAGSSGGGTAIGLDVQILAENRIFVRGRGLDAELGGRLRLTGTTADIIPQGQFELIRGRLDILGKRLLLDEGSARLQGDLIPTLRLVARSTSEDTVLFVIVEGPADAPEILFVSEPELPSDEVLARLLFGRGISTISPLQAVQLASAVATLAGRGGIRLVERLRKNTGFDDLDLTTDAEGGTSLRAGKYINENAYTDVEIDSDGQSRINLNLDVLRSTKLRGQVGTDGSTGIGLFFERDY